MLVTTDLPCTGSGHRQCILLPDFLEYAASPPCERCSLQVAPPHQCATPCNFLPLRCCTHILSLVGDEVLFGLSEDLDRFVSMWSGLFTMRPQRKRRYLDYVSAYLPPDLCHHCPLARESRWRTWFEAIVHHVQVIHVYEGFLKQEGDSVNVNKLLDILKDHTRFTTVHVCMMFVRDNCAHVMNVLT